MEPFRQRAAMHTDPARSFHGDSVESVSRSDDGVLFIVDNNGRFVSCNDRLECVLGYRPEELTGKPFYKFIQPEDLPRYLAQLRRVFISRSPFRFSTRILHRNGHSVDAEICGEITMHQGEMAIQASIRDITDRKRLEDALGESLHSYRGLLNTVTEAIYVHKTDGVFIDVNVGATLMYGYSHEELIGRTPELVAAPGKNDLEAVARIMQQTFETGRPEKFEFWGRRKNGEIFPKEVICNKGKYFGEEVLISTARDITERKNAEQALRDSEAKYRILAERMHDVVWIINMDLRVTYVSPSTYAILGFTPEERMAMRIDECMVPESLDYAMQVLINEAVTNQEGQADKDRGVLLELEYYHKDGTTRWLEQSINGIYDENGELSALMGVARDITERRRVQAELQRSEESYRGLFNSVSDAIYVMDEHGKILDINQTALDLYGFSYDDIVGQHAPFFAAEGMNDEKTMWGYFTDAFHGQKRRFDFWGKRASGVAFLKEIRLTNGVYDGKKVVIAIATDISARKERETALQQEVNDLLQQLGLPPRYPA